MCEIKKWSRSNRSLKWSPETLRKKSFYCKFTDVPRFQCPNCQRLGHRSTEYDFYHTYFQEPKFLSCYESQEAIKLFEQTFEFANEEEIGEGGNGKVFKIKHIPTDCFMALKIFFPRTPRNTSHLATVRKLYLNMRSEVKIGMYLNKNGLKLVPKYYQATHVPPQYAKDLYTYGLVMELMADIDMYQDIYHAQFIAEERIVEFGLAPSRESLILNIFIQAAEAVKEIHSLGVLHCDLKAENFMRPRGDCTRYKLVDYGYAVKFEDYPQTGIALHNQLVGTIGSVAPEALILNSYYDPFKADIWSLGIILMRTVTFLQFQEGDFNNNFAIYLHIRDFFISKRASELDPMGQYRSFEARYKRYTPHTFLPHRGWLKSKNVAYLIFRLCDPNPDTRMTIDELFDFLKVKNLCSFPIDSATLALFERKLLTKDPAWVWNRTVIL